MIKTTLERRLGRGGRAGDQHARHGHLGVGRAVPVRGRPAGWGEADDEVSVSALHAAVAAGVCLFDTADTYGCGHSERVLGRAFAELPTDEVPVVTKFGFRYDEQIRTAGGTDVTPDGIAEPARPASAGSGWI